MALRLAREVGGVVLPTLYVGTERERDPQMLQAIGLGPEDYVVGMDFPANVLPSFYFPEEVLAIVVRAYLEALVGLGYRLILLVNGHAAANQLATLERLAVEYTRGRGVTVRLLVPIPGYTGERWSYSHATRGETSVMQALVPDSVDLGTLPAEGPLPNTAYAIVDDLTFRGEPTGDFTVRPEEDPRRATPAEGEARLAAVTAELAEALRADLERLR